MIWRRTTSEPRDPATQEPPAPGLTENLFSLLASASGYVRARLELAGIEGKEAVGAYGKIFALAAAGVGLLLFGYIFLWIGIVAVVAHYADFHWGWMALGVGLLHFIGTAVCLIFAYEKWGQPVFTSTLEEFRKDQEWLTAQKSARKP